MRLRWAFYVGRPSCSDSSESAAFGRAEGKKALPGQIMVFAGLAAVRRMAARRG